MPFVRGAKTPSRVFSQINELSDAELLKWTRPTQEPYLSMFTFQARAALERLEYMDNTAYGKVMRTAVEHLKEDSLEPVAEPAPLAAGVLLPIVHSDV